MQKKLFEHLADREKAKLPLTQRETVFLAQYRESTLDDGKDGW